MRFIHPHPNLSQYWTLDWTPIIPHYRFRKDIPIQCIHEPRPSVSSDPTFPTAMLPIPFPFTQTPLGFYPIITPNYRVPAITLRLNPTVPGSLKPSKGESEKRRQNERVTYRPSRLYKDHIPSLVPRFVPESPSLCKSYHNQQNDMLWLSHSTVNTVVVSSESAAALPPT